jgi:hypothetical protein
VSRARACTRWAGTQAGPAWQACQGRRSVCACVRGRRVCVCACVALVCRAFSVPGAYTARDAWPAPRPHGHTATTPWRPLPATHVLVSLRLAHSALLSRGRRLKHCARAVVLKHLPAVLERLGRRPSDIRSCSYRCRHGQRHRQKERRVCLGSTLAREADGGHRQHASVWQRSTGVARAAHASSAYAASKHPWVVVSVVERLDGGAAVVGHRDARHWR